MQTLPTATAAAAWLRSRVTGQLCADSRQVRPGDGFVAWPGGVTDGRLHVGDALHRGATACLVEQDGLENFDFQAAQGRAELASCAGLKALAGPVAAHFYDEPSQKLALLGVTGTNGKTSITWWLAQALAQLQPPRPCGLVGTLGVGRPSSLVATGLTTPDPVLLQRQLRQFVDDGLVACAMEASSIGLAEQRLAGCHIEVALFTNLSQDHLDYHGSMKAYGQAKAELFAWPGLRAAVINIDDDFGQQLAVQLQSTELDLWTLSCNPAQPARLTARNIRYLNQGLVFEVCEGAEALPLATRQIGLYNISNLLGVMASLRALGVPLTQAVQACADLSPVPGRMEWVNPSLPPAPQPSAPAIEATSPLAVVDYAHTPDALAKALQALRPLAQARGGQLWCVLGCGGDRDRAKRPLMGAAAQAGADRLLITSDNPRSEDPGAIMAHISAGLANPAAALIEPDRAQAVALALRLAGPRDVVLIAGKGHEDYQETAGQRLPFSDRAYAQAALHQRAMAAAAQGVAT